MKYGSETRSFTIFCTSNIFLDCKKKTLSNYSLGNVLINCWLCKLFPLCWNVITGDQQNTLWVIQNQWSLLTLGTKWHLCSVCDETWYNQREPEASHILQQKKYTLLLTNWSKTKWMQFLYDCSNESKY